MNEIIKRKSSKKKNKKQPSKKGKLRDKQIKNEKI